MSSVPRSNTRGDAPRAPFARRCIAALIAGLLTMPAAAIAQTSPSAPLPSAPSPSAAPAQAPATPAAPVQTPTTAPPSLTQPAQSPPAQSPPAQTQPSSPPLPQPSSIVPPTAPAATETPPASPPSGVAAPAAAPPLAPEPGMPEFATLPRDLSPWGMFLAADIVVKAVMIGLAFASVLTWTVWFAKSLELLFAKRRLRRGIASLAEVRTLAEAIEDWRGRRDGLGELLRAAETELRASADAMDKDGVKERVASRLERIESAVARRMSRGTGLLATIGATAPFVGLFGTVWGIMNSFISISKQHTTNLAVVAPGIAEALLATALGLVAAIPAVVIFNMFTRWIAGYRMLHGDAAAGVLRLVSRDLDRNAGEPRAPRRLTISAAE